MKDSNACDYCVLQTENIHLFSECDISNSIWQEIIYWLAPQQVKLAYLADAQILLGDLSLEPIVCRMMMEANTLILKTKKTEKALSK